MLEFNHIRNAVEYSWTNHYVNPKKFSDYIEQTSSDRRYKVSWNALTENSGIFTYRSNRYWFYRNFDGNIDVERI